MSDHANMNLRDSLRCSRCAGTGDVGDQDDQRCPKCNGTGRLLDERCPACDNPFKSPDDDPRCSSCVEAGVDAR